ADVKSLFDRTQMSDVGFTVFRL
ncbi:hypothetical protein WAI87_21460, partial [Acinetobacter baumannii]